jgi:organic hydroperoxide reductase OsmC/OhrA
MASDHDFLTSVRWTGNRGTGTSGYRDYGRDHEVHAPSKPVLLGSASPSFRGEADRWNPEELLVAALAQCHLLAYLHVCVDHGVVVLDYRDDACGTLRTHDGTGEMVEVVLRPQVTVAQESMVADADRLHDDAHAACFIARSVSFPVRHQPQARAASG